MAMAAYLTSHGHTHQRLEPKGRAIAWVFLAMGNLKDLVEEYLSGCAEVEPRQFTRVTGQLRSEMYEALKQVRA